MSVQVTMTFANVAEAIAVLGTIGGLTAAVPTPVADTAPKATKRNTKKPKEDADSSSTPAVATSTDAPTAGDAQAAFTALFNAKGVGAAKAILDKHGVSRVGEVAADKYAAFIADCEKAAK